MKIFIGFENIASIMDDMKFHFEKNGHECFTVINKKISPIITVKADLILENKVDRLVPLFKPRRISAPLREKLRHRIKQSLLKKVLKKYDVFIFLWSSFNEDFSDLEILKKAGKKIIFVFVGDDVRWHFSANQELEKCNMPLIQYPSSQHYSRKYLQYNLLRLRAAEKNCDFIFSRLDQAQLQLRPYHRWNMMVSPGQYKDQSVQNKIPKIIHAPSNFIFKGSSHIINAVNKLKKEEVSFEFELIENLDHEAMKIKIQNCDILIDQLIVAGSGKIATEALASGKVVLANMAYSNYPQKNPASCPIVDVNPKTIYDALKNIILDFTKRQELAFRGRPFVEEYLSVNLFCKKVIDLIEGKEMPYDYYPAFFRNEFIPENEDYLAIYNEGIGKIKNCDWYQKNIQPGSREGLIF